jgi:hypothetical protein
MWRALKGAAAETADTSLRARAATLAGGFREEMFRQARVIGPAEYVDAITAAPPGSKKQAWSAATCWTCSRTGG